MLLIIFLIYTSYNFIKIFWLRFETDYTSDLSVFRTKFKTILASYLQLSLRRQFFKENGFSERRGHEHCALPIL